MIEEAFYLSPPFWVAVSFVVFALLVFRPVGRILASVLDKRSLQIAAELAQAQRLREEAQETLALYQQKQRESLQEAERILSDTREDAQRLARQAEADLKLAIEKRSKLAMEHITQAEARALQDVQQHVVDIAIAAARTIMQDYLARGGNSELVQQAATDLGRKLH